MSLHQVHFKYIALSIELQHILSHFTLNRHKTILQWGL